MYSFSVSQASSSSPDSDRGTTGMHPASSASQMRNVSMWVPGSSCVSREGCRDTARACRQAGRTWSCDTEYAALQHEAVDGGVQRPLLERHVRGTADG